MSLLVTASPKVERVLATYLRAIMAIVFLEFTSVMVTMIVWIILTKTNVINVVSFKLHSYICTFLSLILNKKKKIF